MPNCHKKTRSVAVTRDSLLPLVGPALIPQSGVFNADGGKDLARQLALSGEPVLGQVLDHSAKELGTYDFFQLCHRRTGFIQKALEHWMNTASSTKSGRPVDGVIAPASGCPPSKHDDLMYVLFYYP
jgi:amidase